MFGVSRRLIIFIGCPEKYVKNLKSRAERGGSQQYYHPDLQKNYMKTHRNHKKDLDEYGMLEQGGIKMCKFKQRCSLCNEWFISNNGNRVYCFDCSPKTKSVRRGKIK